MNVQARLDEDGKQVVRGGKPSWRLRWEKRDPGTGARQYVRTTFHGTKREAEREWQPARSEVVEGARARRMEANLGGGFALVPGQGVAVKVQRRARLRMP